MTSFINLISELGQTKLVIGISLIGLAIVGVLYLIS